MTERSPQHGSRQPNGFTLIELMVALAVFALAALTLLRMEGASIAQTADLDRRVLREVVAQNLAVELMTDPIPPSMGEADGETSNMGRSFLWTRTVEPAESGLLRITLSVRNADEAGSAATLELVRPGAQ